MIAIGVDIGGTSIKGATVNDKGIILDRFSLKVKKSDTPEVTLGNLCDIINKFKKEHNYDEPIAGIGIGAPGMINFKSGIVLSSPNLPTWTNFNLKTFIQNKTELEVRINNDASVAALGEASFGVAQDYKDVIMLTLGTGVGGGIILDHKIYDGHLNQGAELGHMVIKMGGRLCGCGRKGCLEAYASATGLIIDTKEAMKKNPDSLMHKIAKELGEINGVVAFEASKLGDKAAKKVVRNYVKYLSEGILNYCNIFRPEIVVLSGGVANQGDYLFDMIRKYLIKNNYGMKGSPKVEIKMASLGYDSGKIGAACLVLKNHE